MLTKLVLTALALLGIVVGQPVPKHVEWEAYCQVHMWAPPTDDFGHYLWRQPPVEHFSVVPCREWDNFRKTEFSA